MWPLYSWVGGVTQSSIDAPGDVKNTSPAAAWDRSTESPYRCVLISSATRSALARAFCREARHAARRFGGTVIWAWYSRGRPRAEEAFGVLKCVRSGWELRSDRFWRGQGAWRNGLYLLPTCLLLGDFRCLPAHLLRECQWIHRVYSHGCVGTSCSCALTIPFLWLVFASFSTRSADPKLQGP